MELDLQRHLRLEERKLLKHSWSQYAAFTPETMRDTLRKLAEARRERDEKSAFHATAILQIQLLRTERDEFKGSLAYFGTKCQEVKVKQDTLQRDKANLKREFDNACRGLVEAGMQICDLKHGRDALQAKVEAFIKTAQVLRGTLDLAQDTDYAAAAKAMRDFCAALTELEGAVDVPIVVP